MKSARILIRLVPLFWTAIALGQVSAFSLPKYPSKLKAFVREAGPKPGAVAQPDQSATFRRTTFLPAELRLVARANCSTTPGKGGLIGRARNYSEEHGPVAQVDWEPVRTSKPGFWAVMTTKKVIVTVSMREENGRFVVVDKQTDEQETWHAMPLIFSKGSRCVTEKEISQADMRKAVRNVLNQVTLSHYRSPSNS